MRTIFLEIETESPVLLADGPPAGNLTRTLDHIPGAVVLGILAHRFSVQNENDTDTFKRLFLNGGAIFDHAYIDGALPIPQSARSCKYFGGFEHSEKSHGVVDLLLSKEQDVRCPRKANGCPHPTDYFQGYYIRRVKNGDSTWHRAEVHRRIITRSAINSKFGTAATAQLYSHEIIEEGQIFKTRITITDASLEKTMDKLTEKAFPTCIGRARSRGLGWVRVRPCNPFGPELDTQASVRAPRFRDKDGRQLFVATLLSDALFSDDYLRDITLPSISHFSSVKGLKPGQWAKEASVAFADTRMVAGFQGKPWYLPREPRLAVTAGSVIAFRAIGGGTTDYPDGDGLVRIGDRINEGYGHACLWAPFHLEFRPGKEVAS
jgi:CRISPR-associated Csx10 family RAMP protein